jgi:hypothetical protein
MVVAAGSIVGLTGSATFAASSAKSPAADLQCPAGTGTSAPGVSAKQISVAGISTLTGSISAGFSALVPGAIAYFKTVDAHGGVFGRKIVLANNLNDQGTATRFATLTHTAIDQDHAFATIVSSYWFTPTYFVSTCTPTYGYNVTGNWTKSPNLFAAGGSTQTYKTLVPGLTWLVRKLKVNSVGMLAYGVSSSADSCDAFNTGLQKAGVKVSYSDVKLTPINPNVTPDVQNMQRAGTNLIISCMTVGGNKQLLQKIKEYGLKTKLLFLTVPNQTVINKTAALFQGVYVGEGDVPAGAAKKFPGTYPGLTAYLNAMKKYAPTDVGNNVSIQGWEAAELLVAGIKAAGPHFTQASVVKATNMLTEFTAGGLYAPMNWQVTHSLVVGPFCEAFVQVQGKVLEPVLGTGKQVFQCFAYGHKTPVATKPGTPGPAAG